MDLTLGEAGERCTGLYILYSAISCESIIISKEKVFLSTALEKEARFQKENGERMDTLSR